MTPRELVSQEAFEIFRKQVESFMGEQLNVNREIHGEIKDINESNRVRDKEISTLQVKAGLWTTIGVAIASMFWLLKDLFLGRK